MRQASALPPAPVTPTIHIRGTEDVRVQGLHFTAAHGVANCALVIQDSKRVEVSDNHIDQFQSGVLVQHGDKVTIEGNVVNLAPLWADPDNPYALAQYFGVSQGLDVINGQCARIVGNVEYFGVGLVLPASHHNEVAPGSHRGLTIRDCGEGNVISADTSVVPCPY